MLTVSPEGKKGQSAKLLVLDSGAVTRISERSLRAAALVSALKNRGLWPPVVPSPVLIEALFGEGHRDAAANRMLKGCHVLEHVSQRLARRAALLRYRARRGSAVDALVVAAAEPGGTILTSDPHDLSRLAIYAQQVAIEAV